jgi:membrane associated rhomboid family serine protease
VVLFPIFFFPFFFEVPAVFYLVLWFLGQLFSGTAAVTAARTGEQVGGIAWWAHIGGFVSGMILCWLFVRRPSRRPLQPDEHALEWAWQPRQR